MGFLDQSGVTGGRLDPYNVHALFVNMDNMWLERFGNFDYLVDTYVNTVNPYHQQESNVRSNTHNVHPSVTPSATLQLKYRLHPYEGI